MIWKLIQKDLLIEWRQRYAFNGILLYLASVVFLIYISFIELKPEMWVMLYWIIMLFTAVNAVVKSFLQEGRARWIYYYSIASPLSVIISKMIYNTILMLLMGLLGTIIYSLLLDNPLLHPFYFLIIVLLGSISFSFTFTLMSAVASKAGNSAMLMPVLSFPVIIPVLLLLVKLSNESLYGTSVEFPLKDFVLLIALDAVMLVLGMLLFPFLWRE
ncbi:MAG TPA: ABC transporter permease [Bacteroidetes bacterium]|nr:ABC transporter permease [Bacteroidota bacterium]